MRTGKILTFAAIMLAAVVSGCSNGNKQDTHTDTSEVVFSRQGGVYDEEFELELTSKGIIYYSCGIARQNWFTYNKTLDTSGLYWMER